MWILDQFGLCETVSYSKSIDYYAGLHIIFSHLSPPILPGQDEKLLLSYLRGVIVELALNFAPTHCLVASLEELKRDRRHHSPILGLLQDLSCHSSFPVRRYTATLLGVGRAT